MVKNMRNKRGWIRIVEAFISILLITGVLLIVINKGYILKEDISLQVYKIQLAILREIQLDPDLRSNVLVSNKSGYSGNPGESPLPIPWEEFDNNDQRRLENIKNKILNRSLNYLECEGRICEIDEICSLDEYVEKDIYSQSVVISADLKVYSPRQLKLFCWRR